MPDVHDLTVDRSGERLDVFVARRLAGVSRSRAQRLIDDRVITLDGSLAKAGTKLAVGQRVQATLMPEREVPLEPEPLPLSIVYEDDGLLVVDKPPGIAVHPSPGYRGRTLVKALLAHCPELSSVGGEGRPGIVHRLDKDTSGLIIAAKTDAAHVSLARQLKERQVEKTYLALVEGQVEPAEGVIDAPIGRHPRQRKRMAVLEGGRDARTAYKVLRDVNGRSLLEVRPETGRTHQIRVHLASIGYPVVGDRLYSGRAHRLSRAPRQFLHAQRLAFRHPATDERLELEAPLPRDLAEALEDLERA